MDDKVIFINGFQREEVFDIMRAVKKAVKDPEKIAFCMGTEDNMSFTVKELISQVSAEHHIMTGRKK
ncbi:MAG: DUF3783 domain-containing protein [Spirochaetia bacterium]|nr:DUF3783 domain-containing protein [Spirochaetia bacterium]